MALTTYDGLKTAIATWMARDDLGNYIPDFIQLAESYINRRLRCREMMETVTLSPASGIYTLPDDYLSFRRVVMDNGTRYVLKVITPEVADQMYSTAAAGIPIHFTIIGDEMRVFPSVEADIELTYWQKIPALSSSVTTNWLLEKMPEIYLRTACFYAADFIKDSASAQSNLGLADSLIEQLQSDDTLANYSRAGIVSAEVRP